MSRCGRCTTVRSNGNTFCTCFAPNVMLESALLSMMAPKYLTLVWSGNCSQDVALARVCAWPTTNRLDLRVLTMNPKLKSNAVVSSKAVESTQGSGSSNARSSKKTRVMLGLRLKHLIHAAMMVFKIHGHIGSPGGIPRMCDGWIMMPVGRPLNQTCLRRWCHMFMIDLRAIGGGFDGCEQAIQARKAYVVKTFSNVQEACPGSMPRKHAHNASRLACAWARALET